jgi:hypothetical protein
MDDNVEQIRKDLQTFLYHLRLSAEVHVVQLVSETCVIVVNIIAISCKLTARCCSGITNWRIAVILTNINGLLQLQSVNLTTCVSAWLNGAMVPRFCQAKRTIEWNYYFSFNKSLADN